MLSDWKGLHPAPSAAGPLPGLRAAAAVVLAVLRAANRAAATPPRLAPARAGVAPGVGRLVVGPGIALAGEVAACDRLVVQGSVQVTLSQTRALEVAEGGRLTDGRAEVEEAEVSGVYEGELIVRGRLLVRGTGRVTGTVRCGELVVEQGGQLEGAVFRLEGEAAGARDPRGVA